jgi:catechol 2,3-dioxygenase-like lactoylglutathione lyase family enzyme
VSVDRAADGKEDLQMNATITAITLGVHDIDRARRFYERGLGCTVDKEADGFVALGLGDVASTIGLYTVDALAADAGVDARGIGFRGAAMSFITDAADEVDAVFAAADKVGGTVVKPARSQFWGGYSGYVADPDGHLWKVASNHRPPMFGRRETSGVAAAPPAPKETAITLACQDIKQSKAFYSDALGFTVDKSFGKFASFKHGERETMLSLYTWSALADDAGVDPSGQGFRALTLSCVVAAPEQVDEILVAAAGAGAGITEATEAPWGGYSGFFTDPSGHLWKVASAQTADRRTKR